MKKLLFILSLSFNLIFLLLLVSSLLGKTSSVLLYDPKGPSPCAYGVFAVSVPGQGAGLVFGPAEFSLEPGSRAAVQFSVLRDGRQMNLALEPLYDRSVVSIEQTGYGIAVRALKAGETSLQIFSQGAFRSIALITVAEGVFHD